MHKLIDLKSSAVQIKMDLPVEDFKYFTSIIQNNVLLDWVENKKVDKITDSLNSFINDQMKQLYIIVVAQDPAYNLSYKKNRFLIVKLNHVSIFIYQAKPTEFPKIGRLSIYNPKENTTRFVKQMNLSDSEFIHLNKVQSYLDGIIEESHADLETHIVVKLKPKLQISFNGGFWHIFCSRRLNSIVVQSPEERYLEFAVEGKNPLSIVAFQKQGPKFNILEKLKLKTREIISFFVLLTFFATLIGCKESQKETVWGQSSVREELCSHRSEVLGMSAVILFGLLAQRMVKKYMDKKRAKSKSQ